MKKLLILISITGALLVAGCSKDKLTIINNNDRVTDLEAKTTLTNQIVQAQSDLLELNFAADADLSVRVSALEVQSNSLQTQLDQEIVNRENGDNTLDARIDQLQNQLAAATIAGALMDFLQNVRISQLQSQTSGLSNQLVSLTNRVSTAEYKISNLQSQMSVVQGQIVQLKAKDISLQNQINTLVTRVSNAENDIDNLQASLAVTKTRVLGLEISQVVQNLLIASMSTQIGQLQTSLNNLSTEFHNAVTTVGNQLDVINGQIAGLQNQINALPTDSEVASSIASATSSLQTQINALQAQIVALQNSGSSGGSITGNCLIQKTQDYGAEKHYSFSLNNSTGLSGDYKLVLDMSNASSTITSTNGAAFTRSGTIYSTTPVNSQTAFTLYTNASNANVSSAKVVKVSDTTKFINCTVNSSI